MRPAPGFTLLELMVVLAVTGMIALALPRLTRTVDARARVDNAVQALAGALLAERQWAALRRVDGAVAFDLDARTWRALLGRKQGVLPPGELEFLGVAGGASEVARAPVIAFFADGGSTGGTLMVRGDGLVRRVAVDWMQGRVTVHD
jgi:general secretion pathway protein H